MIISVKIMWLIISVRYILVTVLSFFSGAQIFTKIKVCKKNFTARLSRATTEILELVPVHPW